MARLFWLLFVAALLALAAATQEPPPTRNRGVVELQEDAADGSLTTNVALPRRRNDSKRVAEAEAFVDLSKVPFLTEWEQEAVALKAKVKSQRKQLQVSQMLTSANSKLRQGEAAQLEQRVQVVKKLLQQAKHSLTKTKHHIAMPPTMKSIKRDSSRGHVHTASMFVKEQTTRQYAHNAIDVDSMASANQQRDAVMESLLPTPSEISHSPGALVSQHTDGHIVVRKLPSLYRQQTQLYNTLVEPLA